MANDRLFLSCKECKERIMIYKYYPTNAYVPSGIEQEMQDFFDQHQEEHDWFGPDMSYGPQEESPYELLTEGDLTRRDGVIDD